MRRLAALTLVVMILLNGCEKKNPNYEPPAPYDGRVVGHHKFDGGGSDPYGKGGAEGGEGAKGGEAKGE